MQTESAGRSSAARAAGPAVVLTLLLVVAFHGALAGRRFYLRDLSQNHAPLRAYITERLASGALPLWDPYHGGGTPLLANPDALVLHPMTLLFFLLPLDAAFTASIVLQFVLLAAGGFLLARALGLGRSPSTLVGAILVLSGPGASLASLLNVLAAAAWLPLALWGMIAGMRSGRRSLLAAGALFAAVVILPAEPATLLALVLLGPLLALTEPVEGTVPIRRRAIFVSLPLLGAAWIATAQIVPLLALLPLTPRGAGFAAAEGLKWSLRPARLAELVIPNLFGDPTRLSPASWWGGFLFEGRYPLLLSVTLGAAPCLLAAIGALHGGRDRLRRRLLAVVAASGLLLALGGYGFLYRGLVLLLPPLRSIRYPERFVLLALFPLALLAGYGLERLVASRPSRRIVAGLVGAAAAGFLACACAATTPVADAILGRLSHVPEGMLAEAAGEAARSSILRSALWTFAEIVTLLGFAAALRLRPRGRWVGAGSQALVLLSSLSLLLASAPLRSSAAPGWLDDPSPLRAAVGHGIGAPRLHHFPRPPQLSVWGQTDELAWGYRYDRFVYALSTGHVDHVPTALDPATDRMDLKESAGLGQSIEALPLPDRVRALAAARVGYVLSYEPLHDEALDPGPALEGYSRPPARLYSLRSTVPRVRFARRALPLRAGEDLAKALADRDYDPVDAVLLDHPPATAERGVSDGADPGGAGGEVVLVRETPESILLRVRAGGDGYAVLADAYAPGWSASVDGRPVELLRADGLFRAVPVTAGEHTVRMDYRPASVTFGLLAGGLGFLVVCAGGALAAWRGW